MHPSRRSHANICSQSLRDLDDNLQAKQSRLIVLKGRPQDVMPRIFMEWKVTRLAYEVDTEPYSKIRDAEVCALASKQGIQVSNSMRQKLSDFDMHAQHASRNAFRFTFS